MRKLIFIFFLILTANSIRAAELNGSLASGIKYNTNIEDLSIIDRIYDVDLSNIENILSIKDVKHIFKITDKKDIFSVTSAKMSLSFGTMNDFSLDYSIISDAAITRSEFSGLNHSLSLSHIATIDEKTYYNISFSAHHAMYNYSSYENFRHLYADGYLYFDLFYDMTEQSSVYFNLKAGFYRRIDEKFIYMTGPESGIETGIQFHPSGEESYVKAGIGTSVVYLKELEVKFENLRIEQNDLPTLFICNRYGRLYFPFESEWDMKSLILSLRLEYAYLYWFNNDVWNNWSKRRHESHFSISLSATHNFTDYLSLKINYDFNKVISNIGEDPDDYTNYNSDQHIGAISLVYSF